MSKVRNVMDFGGVLLWHIRTYLLSSPHGRLLLQSYSSLKTSWKTTLYAAVGHAFFGTVLDKNPNVL